MQSGGPAEGQPSLEKGPAPAVGRDLFPALARHQTLEKSAYQDLRRAIVEGRFAPGERIVAASVAASAGISRIPVMQALQRLEVDGALDADNLGDAARAIEQHRLFGMKRLEETPQS